MSSFFRRMVEEKNLLDEKITVTHKGVRHFLSVPTVLESIEKASDVEKSIIRDTFSAIDFRNGDLMHYLNHLAFCLVETNLSD